MTAQPVRYRFTVHDYYLMGEAGIFHEDDRVELIEGEIIEMTPIGSRHAGLVNRLQWVFSQALDASEFLVIVQNPVRLSIDSEPQPDIVIARYRPDFYTVRHPGPEEILLIIEVADSSVDYDTTIKMPLYARSGIPEAWVVDLNTRSVRIHRRPTLQGYEVSYEARSGDILVPEKLPGPIASVSEILQIDNPEVIPQAS